MPDFNTATPLHFDPVRLVQDYRPLAGVYDEMCTADGALRPHWEYMIRSFEALGGEELARRWSEARRLLHENGVTYNVYDDVRYKERLWPLDLIPVLLTSGEWSAIEQGLIQRAELLDALLADIYGPRRLLEKGLLPPELIYAHPGFVRPCVGASRGNHHLMLYAADLARTPDGQLVVIGDRTQAPSGAGYALENRTVLSRVLPSLYRDSHVHRLAVYFRGMRAALSELNPRRNDDPRVVLLTPGPQNEAYFEHAYLANYLGYTLVQGGDLVARDDRVWLKTLNGLMPVDVIVRRVDDSYCDPLELRGESLLGTPGLLQAARLGQVAIANPLGSSVLENPALMAFLPRLARELLNEDLKLPSATTWWCGDDDGRAFVLAQLDRLVIKPMAPHPSSAVLFGAQLTTAERQTLAERITAHPHMFVGQEQVALSTAPGVVDGRLEPRPMVLRAFLAARADGYIVMPGCLSRVSPGPETWVVSNQHGGVSKDVWVLASEPERQLTLLSSAPSPLAVTRDGDDVPGRVADDLFWLGRYAERTDGSARLLRELLLRLIGTARAQPDELLLVLLRAVTTLTATYPGFIGTTADERLRAPETELLSVLLDHARVGSVRYDIEALVRTGRSVRDRLSSDASRVVNLLNRELRQSTDLGGGLEGLQRVITLLAAFAGLCAESMSRGPAWRFLEIGHHLERALHAVAVLRSIFVPALTVGSGAALEALLTIAHSLRTFRRRYRSRVHPVAVLDLLLLDENNPRSVAHQLVQLDALVGALPSEVAPRRGTAQRLSLEALAQVRLFDLSTIRLAADQPDASDDEALDDLLEHVTLLLTTLSDELTQRYFSQAEAPQQLVPLL
jgi:uncharacterized circularly permuted ATP-grasp superfamily protein/uncharacterized alpha-E superfamily protein